MMTPSVYQRLSASLLPRGNKKPPRINPSLLREMWRTASSLELLPVGAKTELGEALLKRVKPATTRRASCGAPPGSAPASCSTVRSTS
jgi:hypothetical protein